MSSQKLLVIGAGVSGSILAFWLAKNNPTMHITVIERSRANQKLGQGIEIEEPALQVVKAMGIMDRLNEVRTGESGFHLVDEQARSKAYFDVNSGVSPTGALEMMRGDLTEVLYKAADTFGNVTYRFETTVRSLEETEKDKVAVGIQRRGEETVTIEEFDLVIGADGARSRTREMAMGDSPDWHKPVGAFVAYFSIPKEERDWPNSMACHFTNRRFLWMRPVGKDSKHTSVYLIHVNKDVPALREANAIGDRTKQKKVFAELYSDCGWESKRVVKHMMNADNFYSDELVQVKLPRWSKGRVALCGDSAWAPTPFTGQGNQLAIIGAWVLAQEISRDPTTRAFQKYEQRLRAYVEDSQQIPLRGYAPTLIVPETRFGIWAVQTILGFVAWFVSVTSSKQPARGTAEAERPFDLQMDDSEMKR